MSVQDLDQNRQRLQQLRAEAEARLDQAPEIASQSTDKLLHELQVHQIELEMQNEELRRLQLTLETEHAHYIELYDFAPVAYLTLTAEGLISQINFTAVKLLNIERNQLINKRFVQVIEDDDKDRWYRLSLLAMQHSGKHSIEVRLRRADGTLFFAQLDCLRTETDSTPMLRIVLIDITERKQVEEDLHIAAVSFQTQEGILIVDAKKFILRVNRAFSRITGYSAEDVIGKQADMLCSDQHDEYFYQTLWAAVANRGFWKGEIWGKHKNGDIFPVWQTLTEVTDNNGVATHYVGTLTDIIEQKQAEKVLLEARQHLENQVAATTEELEKIKLETAEVNTALNVILKYRESDRTEAQRFLSHEVETTVLPLLKKLKSMSGGRFQSIRLIDILDTHFRQLVKSYGRSTDLATALLPLTPIERQVASMVRQGHPTKVIAASLHISSGTVAIHRKHIRKKLGLDGQPVNLFSYLASLDQ